MENKGIPVLGLMPGCHAERAGVKVGDQIVSVNGQEINTWDDYVAASALRNHSRTVVVVREGVSLEIEMVVGPPVSERSSN